MALLGPTVPMLPPLPLTPTQETHYTHQVSTVGCSKGMLWGGGGRVAPPELSPHYLGPW